MAKILGKGDFRIVLSFYAHGEWHKKVFCKKTLKGAYILARVIQHNYNGAMFMFHLFDNKNNLRWSYYSESNSQKWLNRHMLQNSEFGSIVGYKSIMQGA